MPYQRRLRKVGNSYVVALPEAIRNHLGLSKATDLHWHRHGPKEALLTLHSRRAGGKPPAGDAAAQLDLAHAEIERLRVKLQARPMAVYREGYSHGHAQGSKLGVNLIPMIDALRREVADVAARVAHLPAAAPTVRHRPAPARARRVEAVALPDRSALPAPAASAHPHWAGCQCATCHPSPSAPPSGSFAGGDAASGGPPPQAAHS